MKWIMSHKIWTSILLYIILGIFLSSQSSSSAFDKGQSLGVLFIPYLLFVWMIVKIAERIRKVGK